MAASFLSETLRATAAPAISSSTSQSSPWKTRPTARATGWSRPMAASFLSATLRGTAAPPTSTSTGRSWTSRRRRMAPATGWSPRTEEYFHSATLSVMAALDQHGWPVQSSAWRRPQTGEATGCSPPTEGFSHSAMLPAWDPPRATSRVLGAADQLQELGAGACVLAEGAEHAGRDHLTPWLLHAAHLQAQVPSLDHDSHSPGRDRLVQSLRDLVGHALLQLQAVGEGADDARNLAQADDLPLRQIADVAAAEERQHVVLAQAVERDVLDEHHLVVVLVEYSAGDDLRGTDPVPISQLSQRSRDANRGPLQALPRRVLAQLGE